MDFTLMRLMCAKDARECHTVTAKMNALMFPTALQWQITKEHHVHSVKQDTEGQVVCVKNVQETNGVTAQQNAKKGQQTAQHSTQQVEHAHYARRDSSLRAISASFASKMSMELMGLSANPWQTAVTESKGRKNKFVHSARQDLA